MKLTKAEDRYLREAELPQVTAGVVEKVIAGRDPHSLLPACMME